MAYGLCVQVSIMFMYNMFDFNDKILYDVREGLFQCSYMYMYLSICVNEWIQNFKKAMSFHLWIGINYMYIQNSCNIYLPGNIPKKMGWLTSKET